MKQLYRTALRWVTVTAAAASMLAGGAVANASTSDGATDSGASVTKSDSQKGASAKGAGSSSSKASLGAESNCTLGVSTFAQCFPDPSFAQAVANASRSDGRGDVNVIFTQELADRVSRISWDGSKKSAPVKSLEGAQYLHKVSSITLEHNDISDVTALKDVNKNAPASADGDPNGGIDIDLNYNKITDISPLTTMTNCTSLYLTDNPITTLPSGMSKLSKLSDLELGGDQIKDLTPLNGMKGLQTLGVADDQVITNVRGLDLPALTQLALDNDYSFDDLTGIGDLKALQQLSLECGNSTVDADLNNKNGALSNLGPLASAKALQVLNINQQSVSDLTPLSGLSQLQTLDAAANKIVDISPIKGIRTLNIGDFSEQHVSLPEVHTSKDNKWTVKVSVAKQMDKSYVAPSSAVATYNGNAGTMEGNYDGQNGVVTWKDPAHDGVASVKFDENITMPDPVYGPFVEYSGTIEQPYTATAIYTVSFDSKGGSAVPSQSVHASDVAVKPTDPTFGHNKFDGWYSEKTNEPYDFTKPVTDNLDLYAKWITSYSVKFDLNYSNAPQGPETQTVDPDGKATKPADPHRDGYVFKGWSTKPANGSVYDFNDPVTGDMTLYAQWEHPSVGSLPMTGGAGVGLIGVVAALLVIAGGAIALHLARRKH